jgi:outer membrane protein assembly factor BamB
VLGPDGTIYLGSAATSLFYAINPSDGSEKWSFNAGNSVFSSAAIGVDGTVYFGAGGALFALNPANGQQKWSFATSGRVNSSPAIASDGTIYVGDNSGVVYAVNSGGLEAWHLQLPAAAGQIHASPTVGADGVVYVKATLRQLFAVGVTGAIQWTLNTEGTSFGDIQSSPALTGDGRLYFGSGNFLYSVATSSNSLAASPWPKIHHDNHNTGRLDALALSVRR